MVKNIGFISTRFSGTDGVTMETSKWAEVLRKIFEANSAKSTIVLKGKCSDCGCETIVNITSTSGGFGLQGGALFKYY